MHRVLICCLLIGMTMLTACAGSQDPTPTLMPPLPTDGPSPTPTSVAVVLTPITVTGEPRATATATAVPSDGQPAVYDPSVTGPVAPEDVLFIRAAGGLSTETQTIELWAVVRDGSNARRITSYNPRQAQFAFISSPDGRYAAVSDTPGAVLIDLQAATKTVLVELLDAAAWVGQFAWSPDSKTVYYAGHGGAGTVTLYRHTVDPMGAPEALQGSLTLGGLALYPHVVLPDGRLLLIAAGTETFQDAAVYDPASRAVTALDTAGLGAITVLDTRGSGEVLFQPISAGDAIVSSPLYIGMINAAGQIEGAVQVTEAGYGAARFLPNGGFGAISYLDPLISRLVIFPEPNGQIVQGVAAQFPDDGDYETGFAVLDANTLRVNRTQPPEIWIYPLDGGAPYELIGLTE